MLSNASSRSTSPATSRAEDRHLLENVEDGTLSVVGTVLVVAKAVARGDTTVVALNARTAARDTRRRDKSDNIKNLTILLPVIAETDMWILLLV